MAKAAKDSHAVVVLPPGRHGMTVGTTCRTWLSGGRITASTRATDVFSRLLGAIGHPVPTAGFAALRFWGQTGERPGGWLAAADPVHLEARLAHVCLHALHGDTISSGEMRELFDYLQTLLGEDGRYALVRIGRHGYLRAADPLNTATVPPALVDGYPPDEFLPGCGANATHDRLLSEVQMALHDHDVNHRRIALGRRPVNSLWFWGGGNAPLPETRPIPALFADDPLYRGYWHSCEGTTAAFDGDFDSCLDIAPRGFVAVTPDESEDSQSAALESYLEDLRIILRRGNLQKLTLLFRDGHTIEFRRGDVLRFWRQVWSRLTKVKNDV